MLYNRKYNKGENKMKKILIIMMCVFVAACSEDQCRYEYSCVAGEYKTISEISYSRSIHFCCNVSDKDKIAKATIECVSGAGGKASNTKNQDYHEIPKTCSRAIMQTYCHTSKLEEVCKIKNNND